MTDRELMQQAADVLQAVRDTPASKDEIQRAWIVSDLLKRRLAQPEQEPMHNVQSNGRHSPLLTHMMNKQTTPPQRKPLTDEEIDALVIDKDGLPNSHLEFARAIEAAHGIKGEA